MTNKDLKLILPYITKTMKFEGASSLMVYVLNNYGIELTVEEAVEIIG